MGKKKKSGDGEGIRRTKKSKRWGGGHIRPRVEKNAGPGRNRMPWWGRVVKKKEKILSRKYQPFGKPKKEKSVYG